MNDRRSANVAHRRDNHLLVELARLPWWVSLIFAAVVFAALRWVAPVLAGSQPVLAPLAQVAAAHAHWLAAIFLLPIPFALFNVVHRGRLVDAQASVDRLRQMPWQAFERLVAEMYRRDGYRVAERGGVAADGGIDLELRTKDKKVVVQCKRWRSRTIGVQLVRELYGAMVGEDAHSAIFVTSGRYTPDAIDFARDKPIKLVDGRDLVSMLDRIQGRSDPVDVDPKGPRTTRLANANHSTLCPRCGSAMVQRVAKKGANVGSAFWGCSRFPACRGTLTLES